MKKRGRPQTKRMILVIPDAHARKDVSNRRFTALGRFIADKRPDIVVNIGDLADMSSLCSYDKGTFHAEGRRYVDDIQVANDALAKVHGELTKLKAKPKFYFTVGNHENRIYRASVQDPSLYGTIGLQDIQLTRFGYKVIPYLSPLVLQGIVFQHYFTSGIMGRPIGGENHARTLVKRNYLSSVCGHSHARDYWEDTRADGKKAFGLVVGCYDEGDHAYTTEQKRWWSGLVILHEVHDGQAEPAFYSIDYILRKYL